MNQQESIPLNSSVSTLNEVAEESSNSLLYIIIAAGLLIALMILKLSKTKRKQKNIIALIGQRFSGKTQLFINLNQGKKMKTVPSIHNNSTQYTLNNKKYQMTDFIGDNISKQEVLQRIPEIHTIIHIIDGTDQKSLSDASMFLYKVLVSKEYQKNNCNYIIFLNKSDLPGYIGKTKAQQKLEDEIQHIKQSRINQGEQVETQDDYIKFSKNRFKIPFKIIQGSAQLNFKDLSMTLQGI